MSLQIRRSCRRSTQTHSSRRSLQARRTTSLMPGSRVVKVCKPSQSPSTNPSKSPWQSKRTSQTLPVNSCCSLGSDISGGIPDNDGGMAWALPPRSSTRAERYPMPRCNTGYQRLDGDICSNVNVRGITWLTDCVSDLFDVWRYYNFAYSALAWR